MIYGDIDGDFCKHLEMTSVSNLIWFDMLGLVKAENFYHGLGNNHPLSSYCRVPFGYKAFDPYFSMYAFE